METSNQELVRKIAELKKENRILINQRDEIARSHTNAVDQLTQANMEGSRLRIALRNIQTQISRSKFGNRKKILKEIERHIEESKNEG